MNISKLRSKSAIRRGVWLPIGVVVAWTQLGCASGDDPSGDLSSEVGMTSAPLAYWTNPRINNECVANPAAVTGYWDTGNTVDFCFVGPASAADRTLVMNALAQWDFASGLTFRWNGTCPATPSSTWVTVYLERLTNNFGGNGSPGRGNRLTSSGCLNRGIPNGAPAVNVTGFLAANQYDINIVAGGALGTATYRWRTNGGTWSATATTRTSAALGTTGVTASFPTGTYRAGDTYNFSDRAAAWANRADVQVHIAGDTDNRLRSVALHELGHVLGFYHEQDRHDSFHNTTLCAAENGSANTGLLTVYDPVSIMSYCREPYGLPLSEWSLTHYDVLGAEIMYPHSRSGHALSCSQACFQTNGGVVVRGGGRVTSDFVARGAVGITPTWREGSATTGPTTVTYAPTSSAALAYSYVDQRGRTISGQGTVSRSNAAHTAMLNVIGLVQ